MNMLASVDTSVGNIQAYIFIADKTAYMHRLWNVSGLWAEELEVVLGDEVLRGPVLKY